MKQDSKSESVSDKAQLRQISDWLKTVKFKRKLLGGVDEADVWKKIEELNALYEKILYAERCKNKSKALTEEGYKDDHP